MNEVKVVAKQTGIVLVLSVGFAVAANSISPVGLSLTRDYFPTADTASETKTSGAHEGSSEDAGSSKDGVVERLKANGLQAISHDRVVQFFGGKQHRNGKVVFIDARGKSKYRQGHIPGAYPFSHYRIEAYLGTVLPVCEKAETIIVYCQGADCQDSEMAAMGLRDLGVPAEKIHVYIGGITAWRAASMPIVTGERNPDETLPSRGKDDARRTMPEGR